MRLHHFNAANLPIVLAAVVLASCDKPQKLEAEREKIAAERQVLLNEIATFDNNAKALGRQGFYENLGETNYAADALWNEATRAEHFANERLQAWSQVEAQLKTLHERITAFKAKIPH